MRSIMYVMLACILVLTSGFEVSPAVAQQNLAGDPAIVSVSPSNFASGVNQPVTITGTDLSNVSSATLGDTALRNLHVTSATQVTALVPWSIPAGTYDLTIQSAGSPDSVLPDAVIVSTANNDWIANGPFGGDLHDVVLDPVDASRIYVSADRSGVFKSQDSGANWNMALAYPSTYRTQISYPTPGQPPVIYIGGNSNGMQRSLDYGQTWQSVELPSIDLSGMNSHAFVRPDQPNWVYLALSLINSNEADPDLGLYVSPDQGANWSHLEATAGLPAKALAFDPDDNNHMILGTEDGKIYTSTDGGITWSDPVTVSYQISRWLTFAPNLYNGTRSLWVSNDYDNTFRSNDGGLNWTTIPGLAGQRNFGITYHDTIPGLLWAGTGNGYFSADNGDTWTALDPGIPHVNNFAVVPGTLSRQTTILFAATQYGLYKSTDGGDTWVEFDDGIAANLARTIAISPFNADEAYAATQAKGLQHTFDGGRSWQALSIPIADYGAPIAPDPFTDGKVYFGDGDYAAESVPTVRVSSNHGSSFTGHVIPLPSEYADRRAGVATIAPDPQNPNQLLAGICIGGAGNRNDPAGPGLIYTSTDGGATWVQQATPAGTTCVSRLAFDPQDPNVVYAGSSGSGLMRSSDRGATWIFLANQPTKTRFLSVEIDPTDSNSIYLCTFEGGIFATHDGGDTWMNLNGGPDWAVKLVKVGVRYWLYAATLGGLRYLKTIPDDPNPVWENASGIAGLANVDGFNAASEDGRIVYYIGTTGGTRPSAGTAKTAFLQQADAPQYFPGGIYRAMVDPSSYEIPGWQLRNRSGFGNSNNQIFALEVFNGQLYAATSSWADGNGARIWRLTDGNTWTPASEMGMSVTYGSTNSAITDLVTFKGQLYASVGWGANNGQIWRTSNGTDWIEVTGDASGVIGEGTAMILMVFEENLYAGTGSEIWRSSTGDSGSWERVAQNGLGNPNNNGMTGAATFNGALYFLLNNSIDGDTVWRTTNGTDWIQVNTNGFGDTGNSDSGGMATLNGYLYAGILNNTTGGQVWRYDGSNWTRVVGDGFGNVNNSRIESLYNVRNWLFAVTQNSATGVQVWRTANGTNWTALNLNGFGNPNNNDVFWSNASTVFEDTFFVGTQNGVSGGEVWQYVGSYGVNIYLPLIMR